jgi:hypothetical protein
MVTDGQLRVLRRKLMEGKIQKAAAAGASMDVRSAQLASRSLSIAATQTTF